MIFFSFRFKLASQFILWFFLCPAVYCQNVKPSDVLGQTPQASALGKFLTIPVGYYTGIPETNIPIFTIKTSELTVPISLSYHGGGIKVEEVASNVGLGWSLIGGGAIIQQVNGLPDQKGYMTNDMAERTKNFIHLSKAEQMEFCILTESLASLDTEPDIFYYTFNGESGKFFFDTDGKTIITIPLSKNQISFDSETSSWEIVSTDGTIYRYSAVEVARTIVQESPSNNFSTNWYVSEIISPNKVDRISFNYYTEYTEHTLLNSEVAYRAIGLPQICVVDNGSTQYSYVKSESRVLSSIQFPGGLVKFIRDTVEREDLKGSRAIKSIEVYDNTVNLIKKAALDYSYGGSTVAKRLFLDKVRFINQSLPNNEEKYSFHYLSKELPSRTDYGQDFWGYYNGMKNYQLIPTLTVPSGLFEPHEVTVPGANRNPTMAGLSGTLIKMELPSGGIQEYDYEQNVARNMVAITTPIPPISYLPGGGAIHADLNEDGSIKLQYSFEFSTPDDNSTVQITFRNGPTSEDGRPGPMGYIQNDKLQNIFSFSRPFSQVKYKFDKKGKYRFYIDFAGSFTSYAKDFHFGAGILAPPGTVNPGVLENAPVGGYRLKRSKLTDPKSGNEIIKRYTYLSSEDNTRSSGFLPSRLSFWEYFLTSIGACQVIKLSSYSNATLSTTAGAPVGYDHVTEYLGENGEFGKNEYFFTNAADKIWRNPYALTSREHHRGKLSGEYNYKFENGKHILIKSISNSYADSGLYVSAGLKIADHQVDPQLFGIHATTRFMRNYRYNYYDIETDFYGLSSQTISTYNDKDTSWVIHDYKYNPGNLLISSEVQRDKSRSNLTTFLRYPYDMVKRGELIPYEEMLAKNVISPVIEEEKKKNETSLYVLKNEYDSPFKTFFKAKHIFLKNGAGLFEKRVEYNYDRKGNVINIIKEGVIESSYLWSYNGQYPIAEINNAKYSAIESLLGGNLNVESFSEKSNPTDIEVRNFLNPLRNPLNLLGSTSSTFTYKPLIGMSSSEDVKGLKTYYDYDNYNRLWNVRDHNRNIIKNYEYNYQHKEVRTYSNTFQSAVFKKRCQVGQVGSDVVFSVQEGTFHSIIDVNDANRQAIAHIQANGQAYANINGTCNVNTATLTYSYTYGSPWTITGLLVDKATNQSHFLFGGAQSISSLVIPQGEYRLDLTWAPTAEQGKYYVIGLNGNNQTINTSYGSGKQSYDLSIVGPYAITLKYQ